MGDALYYLGGALCLLTLGILAFGIGGFGTGKMTPKRQNKMMRWRIIAQFTAVVVMLLTVWVTKGF